MHREIRKGVWRGTKMAEAQNCTPRSVWRGSQTPQRLLDTPRSVRRGTKILNQENVTPEVCPEVVRNAVTTFSTSPKGMPSRVQTVDFPLDTPEVRLEVMPKESLSFSTAPRSVLRGLKIRNPESGKCDPRGLPCDTPKMPLEANPAYSRGPSFRFRKILNQGKPEEVLRTTAKCPNGIWRCPRTT